MNAPSSTLSSLLRKKRIVNRLRHNRLLTRVKWVWLYAVDHVFVALKNHYQFSAVLVPNKDAPTITAAENILLTPEISFFDLQRDRFFFNAKPVLIYCKRSYGLKKFGNIRVLLRKISLRSSKQVIPEHT